MIMLLDKQYMKLPFYEIKRPMALLRRHKISQKGVRWFIRNESLYTRRAKSFYSPGHKL